jgi:hypothetical protein
MPRGKCLEVAPSSQPPDPLRARQQGALARPLSGYPRYAARCRGLPEKGIVLQHRDTLGYISLSKGVATQIPSRGRCCFAARAVD